MPGGVRLGKICSIIQAKILSAQVLSPKSKGPGAGPDPSRRGLELLVVLLLVVGGAVVLVLGVFVVLALLIPLVLRAVVLRLVLVLAAVVLALVFVVLVLHGDTILSELE